MSIATSMQMGYMPVQENSADCGVFVCTVSSYMPIILLATSCGCINFIGCSVDGAKHISDI